MKKLAAFFLAISFSALSGCIAPLSSNFSGRSLGKGKTGLDVGALAFGEEGGGPALKFAYGMTPHFDIGLQFEFFTQGLFGKYSFINPAGNGFALAGLFGGGTTVNGVYAYTGPVLSYKINFFEPYFVGRYNYVHYNETTDIWSGDIIEAGNYFYFQLTFGSIIWINRKIGLNFEVSAFSGTTWLSELEGPVFMGGLKFRF
jgi:hypothetical protein